MSIATAINNLKSRVAYAYTALENKGAAMPSDKTTANLSATVDSIPTPKPIIGIDAYGHYDKVTGTLTSTSEKSPGNAKIDMSEIKYINGYFTFRAAFSLHSHGIEEINFSGLKEINGRGHFYQSFGSYDYPSNYTATNGLGQRQRGDIALRILDFSQLQKINGEANFAYATYRCQRPNFERRFNSLTEIDGNKNFYGFAQLCATPRHVNVRGRYNLQRAFRALQTVRGSNNFQNAFTMNTSSDKGDMFLPELRSIVNKSSGASDANFYTYSAQLENWYLPKLVSVTYEGATMPSNGKSIINWSGDQSNFVLHFGICNEDAVKTNCAGYSLNFGLTDASQIVFDLVNYITVDGVVYERYAPYDSETFPEDPDEADYFAWVNGVDVVYTKTELNNVVVGDQVYRWDGSSFNLTSQVSQIG